MRTEVTEQEIERYQQEGFLALDGFLSQGEVDELKDAVDATVREMGKAKVAGEGQRFTEGDSYYDKVFVQRVNLWRLNETVKSYMLSREVGKMLCALAGVDGIRVWHDQALIKEPYANPTAYHLDDPFWSFSSRQAISLWIALEDATIANGCLWFVPGSHTRTDFRRTPIAENVGELFRMYPELLDTPPVAVPAKAGSASVHNGLTAHGGGANMTNGRRAAMTCAYMPDGSTFNGTANILPTWYLETLKEGDVLDHDDVNPLVYHD